MDWWIFFQLLALGAICVYLVYYFAAPNVPFSIKFAAILTWILNFGLVLYVPSDIFEVLSTYGPDTKEVTTAMVYTNSVLKKLSTGYLIMYWSVYILTWTIIPVLQQWENSGDLQSSARLKRSLKVNGMFYLYMIIGAIVSLVILIWLDLSGDMSLITYLKSLASAWGIFLEMVLMGYALVEIPRTHWRTGNIVQQVKYLRFRISQTQQQISSANEDLQELACFVYHLQEQNNSQISQKHDQIQTYIQLCINALPEKTKSKISKKYNKIINETKLQPYPLDSESAIELHRLLKRRQARIHRETQLLQSLIKRALLAEDISESVDSPTQQLKTKVIKTGKYSWMWHCKVKPIFKRVISIVMGLLSLILLISQTQVFFGSYTILSAITNLRNFYAIRVVVLVVLCYITYMVNYSLFRLKLSNLYGLYKKSSDGPSMMFATVNFSRVSVATIVNFFDMIKVGSVFTYNMGGNKLGVLGDWVMKGMPGVLWLIVLMHYFGGWGKFMKLVGLQDWAFKKWEGEDTVSNILTSRREALNKQVMMV